MRQLRLGSFAFVSAAVLAACALPATGQNPTKWTTWAHAKTGTPVARYNHDYSRLVDMDKEGTAYFCLMDKLESSNGSTAHPSNVPCWKDPPRELYGFFSFQGMRPDY
jgi:hypothetical protein